MTSGSWSTFTGKSDSYDAVGLGFNYRLDEPRAALLLSRLRRLGSDVARRRELTRAYRAKLARVSPGLTVPYTDDAVAHSTCYVMPIVVEDESRRDAVRRYLRERHGVQTSLFYPAIHEFTAYRERFGTVSLPRSASTSRGPRSPCRCSRRWTSRRRTASSARSPRRCR